MMSKPAPTRLGRRDALMAAVLWLSGRAQAQTPAPTAPAPPAEVQAELPGARLQGKGQMRFLGLRVYDIRLWAGAQAVGAVWSDAVLALEIEYLRRLDGAQIAERSLTEMRRQSDIPADTAQRWLLLMKKLFPDVRAGDRITGLNLPGQGARFFINAQLQGEVREAEFARLFFGIWLSPRSSEPALREALLASPRGVP